jgi:hypothetical protein
MVSPSWIITLRSPLGRADTGTTGTQFFPDEDDSSATDTWVALQVVVSRRHFDLAAYWFEWQWERKRNGLGGREKWRGVCTVWEEHERDKGLVVAMEWSLWEESVVGERKWKFLHLWYVKLSPHNYTQQDNESIMSLCFCLSHIFSN